MSMDIREEIRNAMLDAVVMDDGMVEFTSSDPTDVECAGRLADALMPLVARIQAAALREAAGDFDPYSTAAVWNYETHRYMSTVEWLRARADRLEQGDPS